MALVTGMAVGGSTAGADEMHSIISIDALKTMQPHYGDSHAMTARRGGLAASAITVNGGHSGLPGIHSIQNFTGQYTFPGFDNKGNPQSVWQYSMIGHSPRTNLPTFLGAPIIPVSLDLRDANGNPRVINGQRLFSDATQFVMPLIRSPIFTPTKWPQSIFPTQFLDAFMRAQFWKGAGDGDFDGDDHVSELWHTFVFPLFATPRTITLKDDGSYLAALNKDGTCCAFVLVDAGVFSNAIFPATATDTTTPIGAAENAHEMTTRDLSTLLFPNTFLFEGNPNNCCILGFHTFDVEPDAKGNPTEFFVVDFASWISPGLFGPTFVDITAVSHELAEAVDDPFVSFDNIHNQTQWWLAPNGNCQDNLETGDVIEGLPNATFPVTIDGVTYHPQNEAMLQWFSGETPSSGFGHAYSFPDPAVLPTPAGSLAVQCGQPSSGATYKPAPLL
jgi:hypothetical protein